MSLRSLLMPIVSQRLLSAERLAARRARAERRRQRRGEPHRIEYFHQADDPYSALLAAVLPRLLARWPVELVPHLVGPPSDAAAPQRALLQAWSRRDAALLARRWGLEFADTGAQPAPEAVAATEAALSAAIDAGRFVEQAGALCAALWRGQAVLGASSADLAQRRRAGEARRQQLGHYLGGTLYYGGEWYWGIDRLHHLERRLADLGLAGTVAAGAVGPLFAPPPDLAAPLPPNATRPPLEFFVSLRSPYSALVTPRAQALARHAGVPLHIRPLLPMAMRGLPVPRAKRNYIALDAAREARLHGIAFGRICDPLGRPTERGLAVLHAAARVGRDAEFLASFMQGVWAEGLDAGRDKALRRMAERAGIDWPTVQDALADESWRGPAEANRAEMVALGLWGVPSFRVGQFAVWGQDRLWAVRQALEAA